MPEDPIEAQVARYNEFLKQREKDQLRQSVASTGTFGAPAQVGKALTLQTSVGADPTAALDPETVKLYEHASKVSGVPVERLVGTRTSKWAQSNPLHFDLLDGKFDTLMSVEDSLKKAEAARVDAENEKSGRDAMMGIVNSLAYGVNKLGALPLEMAQTLYNALVPKDQQITDQALDIYSQAVGGPAATFNMMRNNASWLESKKRATESALLTDPKTGQQFINWGAVNPVSLHGIENIANMVAGEAVPMFVQYLLGAATAPETGGASLAAVTTANAGKLAKVGQFAKAVWAYAKSPVSVVNAARVVTGNAQQGVQDLMSKGMTEQEAWDKVAPGALLSGLFSAAAGSPLEAKIMEDLFTKVSRVPGAGSFMRNAARRLASAGSQALKEGGQEVLEGLGEDLAAFITYQPDKTTKEWAANAIMNFVGGAGMGGVMGGTLHGSQAVHAAQNAAFIQSLHDEKLRSEFVQHAPAKYGEFVQAITQNGNLDNLLVNAQELLRYYQTNHNMTPEEVRTFATAKLGVTGTDFDTAIQNGGDLIVPTGHYANEIAGTEDFQHIYDITRTYQGGPMISEMHDTFAQEKTLEEMRKAMAELPADDPERAQVKNEIVGMLKQATSVLTDRQVEEVADSYARVLAVQAPRVKKTIAQLSQMEQLKIVKDIHAKLDTQYGDDYALTERNDRNALGNQTPAGLPTQATGRVNPGVSAAPGRVQDGRGPEAGRGVESPAVGTGVNPPPRVWSGTKRTEAVLRAEGRGPAEQGGMGPGLHVSAGPHVALEYTEGNPDGLHAIGVRSDFKAFDASMESTYSPEAAAQFGVEVPSPISGTDLWYRLQRQLGPEGAAEHLQSKGFDGLYYDHGGEDAWSIWKDKSLVGSKPTDMAQATADYARQGSRRDEVTGQLKVAQARLWQALPARVPSAAGTEVNLNEKLVSDFEAMLAAPATLNTVLNTVATWPGINLGKGSDKARANRFIEHVKNNLLFLFDKMPADVRDRAKLWYDGAQRLAQQFADQHGKTLQQAAGIIAALSPQQGWFSNIELARQVFDVLANQQDFTWSKEMEAKSQEIGSIAKEKKALANIRGKKLSELTSDFDKAVWLRTYSEAHGDKTFNITSPEGEAMGKQLNKSGTKPQALGWLAGFDALAKVVRVFEDASPEATHAAIGTANKVRNFYNNIFNPSDANYITIDTHAAAAGLLMPLAASDTEATYNFSGNESNAVGIKGSYGLFFEAYKRAAEERGVLPREMQSITWEAVRGLFEADQKKGSEVRRIKGEDVSKSTLYWAANDLWKQFKQGKLTEDQVRQQIVETAGGITPPSWSGLTQKFFQGPAATMDFFQGQLTAESMPGGNIRSGIFPGIANATPEQIQSYHTEKMGIVLQALRDAGIEVASTKQGHGYWDSESNPVTAFVLHVTDEAQLNEAAAIAADVMNDQDAVAWNAKPEPNAPVSEHNAISVDLDRELSRSEVLALGQALEASGLPVFLDASDPASLRIASYDFTPGKETAAQLHSNIAEVIGSVVPADVDLKLVSYKATSNLVERGAFDAKAESGTGTEGSPSLQDRAIRRGRAQVEKLNERYFTQHGWGDAGAGAGGGDVPVFQARSGGQNPVAAHVVHYGNTQGLTQLDGSRYGQGSPGREQQRLRNEPSSSPLLLRSYGYLSEDGGLPRKERVVKGEIPYEFTATNLYDLEADPEGIRTAHPGDGNAIEHAIISAGYDGYISPAAGVPGKAVVMLGHESIPVRTYGGKLDITNEDGGITRVEQPAYHGSPYTFDKFTLDHIGKGEGVQAYGWGLYFAGSESVARYYKDTLSKNQFSYEGKLLDQESPEFAAAEMLSYQFGNKEAALNDLKYYAGWDKKYVAEVKRNIRQMVYDKIGVEHGRLYKVDIPDSGYLLWDKPLSEQPDDVKKALESMDSSLWRPGLTNPANGGDFYRELKNSLLAEHPSNTEASKAASLILKSLGLSGIKYLDGNSRADVDNGTFNYVIFDANAIQTLETYYAGGDSPRGYLEFATNPKTGEPRRFDLVLLEGEDKSTVFHELGHFYLELLGDMAEDPDSDQSVKEDYAKILKWFGVDNRSQITTVMHEKFADGHLVYLMEGNAPVPEIQSSFRNFSKWLSKLAKTLAGKGRSMLGVKVDMTDEVRGVFDRLYAAESEIDEASKDMHKFFTTAEQAGMSQAEFKVYSAAVAKEVDKAKERLTTKLMKQLEREQKADYKAAFAEQQKVVEQEVNARPEYAALLAITNGKLEDGETEVPKLRTEWLVANYGKDILARLGTEGIARVYGPDGVDGDALAAHLNLFDGSGDALVQALTDLPSRKQTIEDQTTERMQATRPDLLRDPAALREAAQEILMGEGREAILTTELQALRRKQAQTRPAVRQAVAQANEEASIQASAAAADREALAQEQQRISADNRARAREATVFQKLQGFRLAASAHISRLQAFQVRPDRYLADQRRNGNESYRAALKGDYEGAAKLKEQEIMSHYLYKEALAAKKMTEDFRTWVKRNDSTTVRGNLGKAGGTFLAQFDALRDRFQIERESNARIEQRESLGEWVQKRIAEAQDPVVAEWIQNELNNTNYRQLTVQQLRELHDAMKNIKHLAYEQNGALIEGRRVAYETMMEELTTAANTNLPGVKKILSGGDVRRKKGMFKAGSLLQGLDATMVKIEQLVNWIDGNDVNGPAHRYIWDRVAKAQAEDHKLTLAINKIVIDAYESMPKAYRESMDQTFDLGMDHPVSRAEILTMLLYNGQQTRYEKLMQGNAGMGLNAQTMAAAFAKLGPDDFKLATAIWKAFDTMKPMVLDLEERLTGIRPKWEENRAFDVYDANGRLAARLEGGYFPLVADPFLNGQIAKKQEGGTVQQIVTANGYSRATTSTGHTKELTGKTYPLLLDFHRILTAELSNQTKDLTHRETVLSLNRLFSNDKFQKMVKEHLGEAYEAQLMPWLVNIANDRNAGASAGMSGPNRLMAGIRANTAAAVIGFKFSSMIVQFADITRVIAPGDYGVSPARLASAMAQLMGNNTELVKMITELSPEMAQRKENLDRDLRNRLNELKGENTVSAKAQRAGYYGLGVMDAMISWPTWLASYQQSMAQHGDMEQAAKEADRTVRMKLMTSAPKDLVTVQANKNPWMQLATMFMGDATSNYNALRNAGHNINGLKGIPTFSGVLLAVMMANIIGDLLKGQWPEKKEDPALWALRKAVVAPFGTAPIIRDFGNVLDNALAGKPFTDWRFSPAVTTLQKAANALSVSPIRFAEGKDDFGDLLINEAESAGFVLGIPGTAQAAGSAKYLKHYAEGKEKPKNVMEFAKGVATGKGSK